MPFLSISLDRDQFLGGLHPRQSGLTIIESTNQQTVKLFGAGAIGSKYSRLSLNGVAPKLLWSKQKERRLKNQSRKMRCFINAENCQSAPLGRDVSVETGSPPIRRLISGSGGWAFGIFRKLPLPGENQRNREPLEGSPEAEEVAGSRGGFRASALPPANLRRFWSTPTTRQCSLDRREEVSLRRKENAGG